MQRYLRITLVGHMAEVHSGGHFFSFLFWARGRKEGVGWGLAGMGFKCAIRFDSL